jgi:hypothetical protein
VATEHDRSRRLPLAVLTGVVLVGAGAALAFALAGGGGGSHAASQPGAGLLPTAPASVATTAPQFPSTPAAATGTWPTGQSAWTVVIASLAKKGRTRAQMEQLARSSSVPGAQAHVLDSSSHPALRPALWIIFAGRFETRAQAEPVARRLVAGGHPHVVVERLTG